MSLVRTIIATLIAVSVVLLPTADAIVRPMIDQAAMTDQMDMPCCPSCCNTHNDAGLTICALNCMGIVGAVRHAMPAASLFSVRIASLRLADDALHEFLKEPPTHPPSV